LSATAPAFGKILNQSEDNKQRKALLGAKQQHIDKNTPTRREVTAKFATSFSRDKRDKVVVHLRRV
jgi:hypothetical protein